MKNIKINASGAYEKDGVTYQYEMSQRNGDWDLSVWNEEYKKQK